jgi:hypothetical protein
VTVIYINLAGRRVMPEVRLRGCHQKLASTRL